MAEYIHDSQKLGQFQVSIFQQETLEYRQVTLKAYTGHSVQSRLDSECKKY